MKKLKTRNEWVASNCRFYGDEVRATSYDWWNFVNKIDGKVIFNGYSYSNSTSGHQWKVRSLLENLGIKVDLYVIMEQSLTENNFKEYALYSCYNRYFDLLEKIYTKGSKKAKNEERREKLKLLKEKIATLKELGCTYSEGKFRHWFFQMNKKRHKIKSVKTFVKNNKNKVFNYKGELVQVLRKDKSNYYRFECENLNNKGMTSIHINNINELTENKIATNLAA